jgi:hypothetical protein
MPGPAGGVVFTAVVYATEECFPVPIPVDLEEFPFSTPGEVLELPPEAVGGTGKVVVVDE